MRLARSICALVLCSILGCSDRATIGGLCLDHCPSNAPVHDAAHDAGAADTGPADAGPMDAGPICSAGAYALTRMRLDLMFIVDDTASVSPWLPALYDGLNLFLNEQASRGIGAGLQRFDEICEPSEYAKPIVPIAPLPGNLGALEDALQLMLTASTSTTPALDGVHRYARTWMASHPDEQVAVVLLTDASPGACDGLVGDWDAEAQRIARTAYQATPSIKTYVVGFGTMDSVNTIASAGGTKAALISVTPPETEVQDALDVIRSQAQPCAFQWPADMTLAPDSEVVVKTSDGKEHRYPIERDASSCGQHNGFYVEDAIAAFPLIACPSSCAGLVAGDTLTLSSACVAP